MGNNRHGKKKHNFSLIFDDWIISLIIMRESIAMILYLLFLVYNCQFASMKTFNDHMNYHTDDQ